MENQLPAWPSHHSWRDYNAKISLNILEEEEYGGLDYKTLFNVYKNYQEMDELHFPLQHLDDQVDTGRRFVIFEVSGLAYKLTQIKRGKKMN